MARVTIKELQARLREVEAENAALRQAAPVAPAGAAAFAAAFHSHLGAYALTALEDGRFLDANDALLAAVGYPRDQVIGRTSVELGFWAEGEAGAEYRRQLKEQGSVRDFEMRFRHRDGTLRHAILNSVRVSLDGKDCIVTSAQDVTAARRAEAEVRAHRDHLAEVVRERTAALEEEIAERRQIADSLLRQQRMLEAVIDNMPAGLFMIEAPSGKPLLTNKLAEILLGRGIAPDAGKDSLGEVYQAFRHGTDQPYPTAEMPVAAALAGRRLAVRDMEVHRPDGTRVLLEVTGAPIFDEQGRIMAGIVIFQDITARQQAEAAVRRSRQQLQDLLDGLFIFVALLQPDGTVLFVNRAPLAAAGIQAADVLGRKFWDCYWWRHDPVLQAQLRDALDRAMAGRVVRYDVEVRMAGDRRMPIDFMVCPVRDEQGRVVQLVCSAVDISARLQAEQESQRWAAVVNHSSDFIGVKELDREVYHDNPGAFAMLGYERGGQAAVGLEHAHPPEEVEFLIKVAIPHALEHGRWQGECHLVHRDGHLIPVEASMFPVRDKAGRIFAVATIMRDITERKQAEEEIRRLAAVLDNSRDFISMVDMPGRPLYHNPACWRMLGYDRVAKPVFLIKDVHRPEDAARIRNEAIPQAMQEGFWQGENHLVHRAGHLIPVEQLIFPVRDKQGQVFAVATIMRDITRRKQAEQELREAKEAAEAASRAKSMFLAAMSHDLRTPLTPVLGFAEVLARAANLTDEQRQFALVIKQRGQDLLTLINDILDLSKVEAGKVQLAPERVNLLQLVPDAVRTIAVLAEPKGLRLEAHIDPLTPADIVTDPLRLKQVLLNLLSNAVKFTEQGSVTLRVAPDPAAPAARAPQAGETILRFDVADTGVGIPEPRLAGIFQPFSQVDAAYSRRVGGVGLGLAITRHLVQLLGGRTWVESRPGTGSTFHFTILAARAGPDGQGAADDPAAGAGIPPQRVLLVEDEPTNLLLIEYLLRRAGHAVTTADSGEAALRVFDPQAFDLVVQDVQLPGMDGLQVLAAIRERCATAGRRVPAIVLTAFAMAGDEERFLAAGFDAYVAKPIAPAALAAAMAKVVAAGRGV